MPFVESDKNLNQLCTFVVSSCDAYKDLWTPYFNLKKRFWPDCPFRTVLISESIKTEIKGVETFNTGQNLSWSAMLRKTIEAVKTPFVLLSMEDFFFQSKVDSAKVENLLDYVIGEDITMSPSFHPKANPVKCRALVPLDNTQQCFDPNLFLRAVSN